MKYLFFQLLLFPFLLFAQASIKGIVLNNNNEPLPLSNIVVLNKFTGTITSDNGAFALDNLSEDDSIKISNVAYQSRVVAIKRLQKTDTILLAANEVSMDEIVVGDLSKYQREQILGFSGYADNGSFKLQPGSQIALYIANEKGMEGYIKGVVFQLKQIGKCRNSLRLRLLNLDTIASLPARDLLRDNILLSSETLRKSNYVDLSRYKIQLPYEGVIVLLEWVFPDNKCDRNGYSVLAANLTIPSNLVWLNFRDGAWRKSNRPRLPNGNFMTPNVGIRVGY